MNRLVLVLNFVCIFEFGQTTARAQDTGDADLDKSMRQYIRAILERDASSFLSLVPRTKPFQFVMYEISTLKKLGTTEMTARTLARDFKAKSGAYYIFFDDEEIAYTYRLTVTQTPFEKWRKDGMTFHVPGDVKSYVRWRQEAGRWVLDEVGDTGP